MIKETIPELQKLSTADKFALAVELWDELSSTPDEMPVTEEQLNELDRRFLKNIDFEGISFQFVVISAAPRDSDC